MPAQNDKRSTSPACAESRYLWPLEEPDRRRKRPSIERGTFPDLCVADYDWHTRISKPICACEDKFHEQLGRDHDDHNHDRLRQHRGRCRLYIDGLNQGDVEMFKRAFHEEAWMFFTDKTACCTDASRGKPVPGVGKRRQG